ncbi:MAG: carboxypeptidase-like regulatory domain-containing protein [Paludibacteraceae bacterium]|nr:carboxypeptidase-like regulatory domain-containing protein [Paludibacteraceae bacterium]
MLCFACFGAISAVARTTRIYGYVVDEHNVGIELLNVYLTDGITGTTTNRNGYYSLTVATDDTITLVYSMIGYTTIQQEIYTEQDVLNINVVMQNDGLSLDEVEVHGIQKQTGTMDQVSSSVARVMPDATGGSIESLLITFAGVSQNNELSTQYNVRGGSYDENSVYVNGIEVHRPLLLRSGQQEGLSFVNPEMVDRVEFSAGGFGAQYGDKMSSVLDITYKRPTRLESTVSLSILGANAYVGWGDSTQSQMHSIRYKTSRYFLGALPSKGNYQPDFIDYQTQMTWDRNKWQIKLLGNFSRNSYRFQPDSMCESFGTMQYTLNHTIWYEGQEKDLFTTGFLAIQGEEKHQLSNEDILSSRLTASGFYTNEQENYDIRSEYVLTDAPIAGSQSGSLRPGENTDGISTGTMLGTGTYHEHARNSLQAIVANISYEGEWKHQSNLFQWGVSGQYEYIHDNISEWEWRDSMGYSIPNTDRTMELYYTLKSMNEMHSGRVQAYLQDCYKWHTLHGNVFLTGGVRLNWWTWTNEVLVSPRASVVWMPGWKRDMTFRFATGLYYQAPFYKELRDTIVEDGVTRIQLSHDLKAQRAAHVLLGTDYYFRAWGRPFKFTVEGYFKWIDRMESYSVENVRIRYSGRNDAEGYTLGLDLKLYGELVPGVDSWISFSTMRSRMRMLEDPYARGWFPQPQEQRYSFSIFFQDYIPKFPQYKFHLKFIISEGLPFGYPRNEELRYLSHMPAYKRLDLGASRTFSAATDKFMRKESARHVAAWSIYFEVFNVIDWKNVNSYYWVTAGDGIQWASPNYLTGRLFNLRFTVDIK